MEKRIIIRTYEEDGEVHYAIDVLRDGYNIIDFTLYDDEDLAKAILERIAAEVDDDEDCEEDNCAAGIYDCETCPNNGDCIRQNEEG